MRARQAAVLGVLALGATLQSVSADTRQNPYQPIVERNAFGLKDPPPPPSTDTKEDAKPPPNVKLTGISNLFQKRALLEVTEQGTAKPGQPATGTVHRPILAEAEGNFGVEVLSIDIEKSIVRIRNNGVESELTFEAPKLSSGPGTPAPGNQGQPSGQGQPPRGASINSAAEQQPMVISSQNAQTTGGGGVTMLGGSTTAGAPNNSGVSTYGGTTPSVPSPLGTDGGLRTIPSRTIRTPTGGTEQQPVDPAQQAIMMEAQRLRQQQQQGQGYKGRPGPPMPPTQLTPPAPQQQ